MARSPMFLLLGTAIAICAGCDKCDNLGGPRQYFESNKVGSSPDYAIVKWNNPTDHVATVHGFMDDMKSCQIMADALNKDACAETGGKGCLNPFSCQPLNH